MTDDLIFIMTRCVQKPEHNRLYQECYRCIRKLYTNPIYIIDDNSNKNNLINIEMSGVEIIQSEFPGAGEILPYYYMYHRQLGKKAVILQDSMFLKSRLAMHDTDDYKFLWKFSLDNSIEDGRDIIRKLCFKLPAYEEIYDIIFDYKWSGCFGLSMILSLEFLTELQAKTGILDIIHEIKTRSHRCALERLLGACTYYTKNKDSENVSLFGSIFKQEYEWGLSYDQYLAEHSELSKQCPIVKVWSGR